jgi:hypothetical protein
MPMRTRATATSRPLTGFALAGGGRENYLGRGRASYWPDEPIAPASQSLHVAWGVGGVV